MGNEPAAFQTLGIQRHAQPIMPEDLHQIAALAAKHVELASMRIAAQCLLDLQGQAIHAAAHVSRTGGQPDPHTGRRRNHPRSAVTTRRNAATLTSCPTLMAVPSGSVISIGSPTLRSTRADKATLSAGGASARRTGTKLGASI